MSNDYFKQYGNNIVDRNELREFLKPKFKRDINGNPIYMTEQSHKAQCDINKIIAKYNKTGLITHVSTIKAEFGDVPMVDYKEMQDRLVRMKTEFDRLPYQIKKRFGNNPYNLIAFMEDSANRKEAEELGLINRNWTEESDGIGEHVKKGENKEKVSEL